MVWEEPSKARSRHVSKWTPEITKRSDAGRDGERNYREESCRPRAYSERQNMSTRAPSRSLSFRRTTPRRSSSQNPPHKSTPECLPSFLTWLLLIAGVYTIWYTSTKSTQTSGQTLPSFFGFGNTKLSNGSIEHLIPKIIHVLSEDHGNIVEAIELHDDFPTNEIPRFPGKSRESVQGKTATIKQHRDIKWALGRIKDDRDQILHNISRESTSLIQSFELQKKTMDSWERHENKVVDTVKNWPSRIASLGHRLSVLTAWCEELHLQTEQLLWTRDRQARADARLLQTDRITLAKIQKVLFLIKSTEDSVLKAYDMAKAAAEEMEAQPRSKRVVFLEPVSVPPFDDDVYKGLIKARHCAAAFLKAGKRRV